MNIILNHARTWIVAIALGTLTSTAAASEKPPQFILCHEYEGQWTGKQKVSFRITSKTPGLPLYHATMTFPKIGRVEKCRIWDLEDGRVMVKCGHLSFIGRPQFRKRNDGSSGYLFTGPLFGRGVSPTASNIGWIWVSNK